MSRKPKRFLIFATVAVFAAGGIGLYLFGGPFVTEDRTLWEPGIAHLRNGANKGAAWASSPSGVAAEYFYYGAEPSKPSDRRITLLRRSETEAIVTIIDSEGDDSVARTYDRLTMRWEGNCWIPVRDQWAQQAEPGRGPLGWTTQPCG